MTEPNHPIDFALFMNHLRHAVVVADASGVILIKNSIFDILFGHGRGPSRPSNLFDILKANPVLLATVKKVCEFRGSYSLHDIELVLGNGTKKTMDVETYPLVGLKGEMVGVNILLYDRSRNIHIEEHQRRSDRIGYLATLASGMAHEIKNPLSGIKGASQLLVELSKDRTDIREYAEIIQKEVVRVDRLLTDLLHFTRPKKLVKKRTNVNKVLHDLVILQRTVEPERVQFLEEFDPSLPLVLADDQALTQVFLNIIKNARQAIKEKGTVTLRSRMITDFVVKHRDRTQQMIEVGVEDTGKGIDAESLPNIFVPFYSTRASGLGLGLAICHQLIEEHGGNIRVRSEKGKGTTFSVYLPV